MSTQLAYMAGLFDGEGSVDYAKRFHKRKNNPEPIGISVLLAKWL